MGCSGIMGGIPGGRQGTGATAAAFVFGSTNGTGAIDAGVPRRGGTVAYEATEARGVPMVCSDSDLARWFSKGVVNCVAKASWAAGAEPPLGPASAFALVAMTEGGIVA